MLIKPISDLHFEHFPNEQAVLTFIDELLCDPLSRQTVLLIAGDLHAASKVPWALEYLAERFLKVVFVPGNHDFYGQTIENMNERLGLLDIENLHVLNPGKVIIDDVVFLGATLFTNLLEQSPEIVNHVAHQLMDFKKIHGLTAELFTKLHRQDVAWLEKQLSLNAGRKKIVLTHYLPSHLLVAETFLGSPLNYGFASDLDNLVESSLAQYWFFGHSHSSVHETLGKTRLLSNPFGYKRQEELNPLFDPRMIIEI